VTQIDIYLNRSAGGKQAFPVKISGSKRLFLFDLFTKIKILLILSKHVLQKSSGIDDIGSFNFPLFSSLFGAWLMIYFIVYKGIKVIWWVLFVNVYFI